MTELMVDEIVTVDDDIMLDCCSYMLLELEDGDVKTAGVDEVVSSSGREAPSLLEVELELLVVEREETDEGNGSGVAVVDEESVAFLELELELRALVLVGDVDMDVEDLVGVLCIGSSVKLSLNGALEALRLGEADVGDGATLPKYFTDVDFVVSVNWIGSSIALSAPVLATGDA
jgi:hypothetical protein